MELSYSALYGFMASYLRRIKESTSKVYETYRNRNRIRNS